MKFPTKLISALSIFLAASLTFAQANIEPVNELPNPYQIITGFFNMPSVPGGKVKGASVTQILPLSST